MSKRCFQHEGPTHKPRGGHTMNNGVLIAASECGSAITGMEGASLEDRLRASMRAAHNHWMVTNKEEQFLAACEAVYRTADDTERERIRSEIDGMNKVAAMLNALNAGVPVNFAQMEADAAPVERIGLRALWDEVTTPGTQQEQGPMGDSDA